MEIEIFLELADYSCLFSEVSTDKSAPSEKLKISKCQQSNLILRMQTCALIYTPLLINIRGYERYKHWNKNHTSTGRVVEGPKNMY